MKAIANRESLLDAFSIAAQVVEARTPKPILRNVMLDVGESASLLAVGMDASIRVNVDGVEVQEQGKVLLPVARFTAILKESTDETISITSSDKGTTIKCAKSRFKLPSENPDEFPQERQLPDTEPAKVSSDDLRDILKRTIFAADPSSGRYALGGTRVEIHEKKVLSVATDGRRMAACSCPAETPDTSVDFQVVPAKSAAMICKIVNESGGVAEIRVSGNSFSVSTEKARITTAVVEGRFPNWKDVVPDQNKMTVVHLDAATLSSAIRQSAIVSCEESRGIDFCLSKDLLTLNGSTSEVGESEVTMKVSYEGEDITIILDHKFVTEFLRTLRPEDPVDFKFLNNELPVVFKSGDNSIYVLSPMAAN